MIPGSWSVPSIVKVLPAPGKETEEEEGVPRRGREEEWGDW